MIIVVIVVKKFRSTISLPDIESIAREHIIKYLYLNYRFYILGLTLIQLLNII